MQGFGSPEVYQIDASGALRRHYWNSQYWSGQSMDPPLDWLVANGAMAVDSLIDA